MAAVAIPVLRGYAKATPRFIDFGLTQTPPGGGVSQRLDRLGSRWALDLEFPNTQEGATLRSLLVPLLLARSAGASYPWPQPGLTIGSPGSVLVNGASQTGTTLNVDAFAASYPVQAGQFFSILTGGRRYLHMVTAAVTASGGGVAALSIFPALRTSPADNSPCNFLSPVIEGLIAGQEMAWDHDLDAYVPVSFSIAESA
jgi:hypothetical protein